MDIKRDNELAIQLNSVYNLESFGTNKHVDSRSAAYARTPKILENNSVHNGLRYDVGRLWAAEKTKLPNNYFSSLEQLNSLKNWKWKFREKYNITIKEDPNGEYLCEVLDAQIFENQFNNEWYLAHHPVVNPNEPDKVRRMPNGAANFHRASFNKSLITGPDLLQNLIYVLLRFRQQPHASLPKSRECSYRLMFYHQFNHRFTFCGGRIPQQMLLLCINIRAMFLWNRSVHLRQLFIKAHCENHCQGCGQQKRPNSQITTSPPLSN